MPDSQPTRPWEALLDELRAEFEVREAELRLLHEIDLKILDTRRKLPDTLAFIARETASLLKADSVQIYLRRGTMLEAAAESSAGLQADGSAHGESILSTCIDDRVPLVIDGVDAEHPQRAALQAEGFGSLVAVPVFLGGTALGALCALAAEESRFGQTQVEMAEAVAAQISIALEHAELFDQSRLFERVDSLIFSREATKEVLQNALEAVFEELHRLDYATVKAAQLLFLDEDGDELEIVHSTHPPDVGIRVSVDDSVSGRALTERKVLVINDVTKDPQYKRMLGKDIKSEIAVPILVGADDLPIGVLNVESPAPDAFGGVYQLLLERFARKVTVLLTVAKLRSDIENALEAHHATELMVAVGDQAANMVHKLNNVVGAMRVRVKEIQQNCAAEVEGSDFLRESLDHLIRGADETLDLPRRVQSFLAEDSELYEFEVDKAIDKALSNVKIPDGVVVDLRLEKDLPPVRSFSLDVAAENLIRNAIDAMPGGGTLRIASSLVAFPGLPRGRVEMSFSDTGSGMSEATRRRLFEIDFTTKARKQGKGMGVGLWWVRQWVRRSGGEVDVQTREGEGTTFVIKLPLTLDVGDVPAHQLSVPKGG
jgi:signal transduction histidine kinase